MEGEEKDLLLYRAHTQKINERKKEKRKPPIEAEKCVMKVDKVIPTSI